VVGEMAEGYDPDPSSSQASWLFLLNQIGFRVLDSTAYEIAF
jgi:hypothetical protein